MIRRLLTTVTTVAALAVPTASMALESQTAPTFLHVHEAFKFTATETPDSVLVHIDVAAGYYLYKTKLDFGVDGEAVIGGLPILPAGEEKNDPYFGDVLVYHDKVDARIPIRNKGHNPFRLRVGFQGCAERGLCYPPDFQSIQIGSEAGTAATSGWTWLSIAIAFVTGLWLAATPVALSMIPILGIVVLHGAPTVRRGLKTSLVFSLSMAAGYTAIGLLIGRYGSQVNMIGSMQTPWALIPSVALLLLAAAYMATATYPLELFSKWSGFAIQQKAMTCTAATCLGLFTSYVLSPWIPGPLSQILFFIGAGGGQIGGGLQIFAMALGMTMPMVVTTTILCRLLAGRPKLQNYARRTCAVLIGAVAIWVAGRILPSQAVLGLMGLLAVIVASSLGVFNRYTIRRAIVPRILGAAILIYGLTAWAGMLKGEGDPLKPLGQNLMSQNQPYSLTWSVVTNSDQLAAALVEARTAGVAALVEWDADWCINCRTVESSAQVSQATRRALEGKKLIRVDVTADGAKARSLLQISGFFGPPAVQLYRANGQEIVDQRLLGVASRADLDRLALQIEQL